MMYDTFSAASEFVCRVCEVIRTFRIIEHKVAPALNFAEAVPDARRTRPSIHQYYVKITIWIRIDSFDIRSIIESF